jgi:hypothetical protein
MANAAYVYQSYHSMRLPTEPPKIARRRCLAVVSVEGIAAAIEVTS